MSAKKKPAKAKPAAKAAAPAPAPAAKPAPKPAPKPVDLAHAFRQSYSPLPPVSSNTVVLDPDVAPHFNSSRAVNDALRALLRIVKQVRSGE